jgi:hypothetical protein
MPIFVHTFDFLSWLLPATNRFPRAQRHSFGNARRSGKPEFRAEAKNGGACSGLLSGFNGKQANNNRPAPCPGSPAIFFGVFISVIFVKLIYH